MKFILTLFISLSIFQNAISQNVVVGYKGGCHLTIKINNSKDTLAYLAYHFGDKEYIRDTTKIDKSGNFVFVREKPYEGGIYMFVTQDKRYFEFLLDKNQNFSIEANDPDFVTSAKFKTSPENDLFFDYLRFTMKLGKSVDSLNSLINGTKDSIANKARKETVKKSNQSVVDYRAKFQTDHPGSMLAMVFHAMQDVKIPEPPVDANGKTDSFFQYYYFKAHFWDNFDFHDSRILRTPVFAGKMKQYFSEQYMVQSPDSIIPAADALIAKAKSDSEIFKYVVATLTYDYETNKIMGMDKVFVHLVEKYYMSNPRQDFWLDTAQHNKIVKRAQTLSPLTLGNRGENIRLQDPNKNWVSLYEVPAKTTILIFYSPSCGHCQKVIPILRRVYHIYQKDGVEVYAVATDTDEEEWKKFIEKDSLDWTNVMDAYHQYNFRQMYDVYATPTMYVLDKDKHILGKRIGMGDLEGFLDHVMKLKDHPHAITEKEKDELNKEQTTPVKEGEAPK